MTDTATRPATDARLHTLFTKGHPTTFTLTRYPDTFIASIALPDGTITSVRAESVEGVIDALFDYIDWQDWE